MTDAQEGRPGREVTSFPMMLLGTDGKRERMKKRGRLSPLSVSLQTSDQSITLTHTPLCVRVQTDSIHCDTKHHSSPQQRDTRWGEVDRRRRLIKKNSIKRKQKNLNEKIWTDVLIYVAFFYLNQPLMSLWSRHHQQQPDLECRPDGQHTQSLWSPTVVLGSSWSGFKPDCAKVLGTIYFRAEDEVGILQTHLSSSKAKSVSESWGGQIQTQGFLQSITGSHPRTRTTPKVKHV